MVRSTSRSQRCAARAQISAVSSSRRRPTHNKAWKSLSFTLRIANNVPPALLSEAQRTALSADGAGLDFGPRTGFVIKFTNGLSAYLSGDHRHVTARRTLVAGEYTQGKCVADAFSRSSPKRGATILASRSYRRKYRRQISWGALWTEASTWNPSYERRAMRSSR